MRSKRKKSLASDIGRRPTLQKKSKPPAEMETGVDVLFEVVAFGGDGKTKQVLVEEAVFVTVKTMRILYFDQRLCSGKVRGRRYPGSRRSASAFREKKETPTEAAISIAEMRKGRLCRRFVLRYESRC